MVLVRISISAIFYANLAQLVEHLPRKEKVGGSTPLVGTTLCGLASFPSSEISQSFLIYYCFLGGVCYTEHNSIEKGS